MGRPILVASLLVATLLAHPGAAGIEGDVFCIYLRDPVTSSRISLEDCAPHRIPAVLPYYDPDKRELGVIVCWDGDRDCEPIVVVNLA